MPHIDYKAELNEQQLAAVMAPDGPVLIIAAAGTGKTRTLTYRVAYLVEQGVDARRILLLTFTNRAAREMVDRARALVGEAVGDLWGGTFHHMANRLLRRHADRLGYRLDYTIFDQDDARSLCKSVMDQLGYGGKDFPKPDVLLSMFGLAANTESPLEVIVDKRFGQRLVDVAGIQDVWRGYRDKKMEQCGMDFDDLLVNGLRLFREHPDLLETYQHRFLYVLVDEYQDTNVIQTAWVDAVAGRHRNLLVVGDDFQSIYSWRGADFRNIMTFPERYPDSHKYTLEINYRSVPEILDVANTSIEANPDQYQKELQAIRDGYQKPYFYRAENGLEQARFICDTIRCLLRDGYALDEMAVLYRSHFHAMELQLDLTREQIPFLLTSGVRFFEQAHIKDVCTIVRLLVNPTDELAFLRLTCLMPRVGKRTAQKLWEKLGRRFPSSEIQNLMCVREGLPNMAREMWQAVEETILSLVTDKRMDHPSDILFRFVETTYDDYAMRTFDNYERRMDDVAELIRFAGSYTSCEAFLSEMALYTNLDSDLDQKRAEQSGRIRLSTVHQAKGLEWKVVFLPWLTDGMFPSARSIQESGGEAEERRLFYVATTRAKDELYFCVPKMRRARDGNMHFHTPSRFLAELPQSLMQTCRRSVDQRVC